MKIDGVLPGSGHGRDRSGVGFLPSLKTLSNIWRVNASSIASSVRSAGASVVAGLATEEDYKHEQVQWASFDTLDLGPTDVRQVLLLTYAFGFQLWDVQSAADVRELVSRRDGAISCLRLLPRPLGRDSPDAPFAKLRPLLAVVAADRAPPGSSHGTPDSSDQDSFPSHGLNGWGGNVGTTGPSVGAAGGQTQSSFLVNIYSLQTHAYVHSMPFMSPVLAVRCSPRIVAVALSAQVCCFDTATLQNTFSLLTFPSPLPPPGMTNTVHGALALHSRWMAYAAHQPLISTSGRVSPQQLTPSPGVSPSTSPANGGGAALVAHYAKESSRHLAAGIVTLGDFGYKTMSRYWTDLVLDGTAGPHPAVPGGSYPVAASKPSMPASQAGRPNPLGPEMEFAGMVIVRDVVSRAIVAQFRAHSSPLSALAFDPSGTLLVTASVCGHNLNVFRLMPAARSAAHNSPTATDPTMAHVHLYKLYRGVTNAVIQDMAFSSDSRWIAVSSTRGTTHLYAILPFGGNVGPHTHATSSPDTSLGNGLLPPIPPPWWTSSGPLRTAAPPTPPPPPLVTLSVISRIKNGSGGWRGNVKGVAAAATGRANSIVGAVSAVFHDGGSQVATSPPLAGAEQGGEGAPGTAGRGALGSQLWVLSPAGHLIRYKLSPYAGGEVPPPNGLGMATVHPSVTSSGGAAAHGGVVVGGVPPELRLDIEPLERWDVCRRPGWPEREERIQENYGSQAAKLASLRNGEGWGADDEESRQRWFMSNAEVQIPNPGARPPIWTHPGVHFHVLLPPGGVRAREDEEVEIEDIPTRPIEVIRRDLVPLSERPGTEVVQSGARSRELSYEPLASDPGLRVHSAAYNKPAGTYSSDRRILHSSSGSSTSSDNQALASTGTSAGEGRWGSLPGASGSSCPPHWQAPIQKSHGEQLPSATSRSALSHSGDNEFSLGHNGCEADASGQLDAIQHDSPVILQSGKSLSWVAPPASPPINLPWIGPAAPQGCDLGFDSALRFDQLYTDSNSMVNDPVIARHKDLRRQMLQPGAPAGTESIAYNASGPGPGGQLAPMFEADEVSTIPVGGQVLEVSLLEDQNTSESTEASSSSTLPSSSESSPSLHSRHRPFPPSVPAPQSIPSGEAEDASLPPFSFLGTPATTSHLFNGSNSPKVKGLGSASLRRPFHNIGSRVIPVVNNLSSPKFSPSYQDLAVPEEEPGSTVREERRMPVEERNGLENELSAHEELGTPMALLMLDRSGGGNCVVGQEGAGFAAHSHHSEAELPSDSDGVRREGGTRFGFGEAVHSSSGINQVELKPDLPSGDVPAVSASDLPFVQSLSEEDAPGVTTAVSQAEVDAKEGPVSDLSAEIENPLDGWEGAIFTPSDEEVDSAAPVQKA